MQLQDGSLVLFDTGGGSSQFTFGHGGEVEERFSVDVGAVRFTERFGLDGAVSEDTLREALDAIAADLERLDGRPSPDELVGIGGAVTNLAAVEHGLETYDPDVVRGTVLDRTEVDRQLELFRERTADQRREIAGLQPSAPRSSSPVRASSGPCSRSSAATRSRSATGGCATGCSGSASGACSLAPDGGARRHVPRRGLALGRRAIRRSRRCPPRLAGPRGRSGRSGLGRRRRALRRRAGLVPGRHGLDRSLRRAAAELP